MNIGEETDLLLPVERQEKKARKDLQQAETRGGSVERNSAVVGESSKDEEKGESQQFVGELKKGSPEEHTDSHDGKEEENDNAGTTEANFKDTGEDEVQILGSTGQNAL